jgi:hypothetical protein
LIRAPGKVVFQVRNINIPTNLDKAHKSFMFSRVLKKRALGGVTRTVFPGSASLSPGRSPWA